MSNESKGRHNYSFKNHFKSISLQTTFSLSDLSIKVFLANTTPMCSFPFLSSVMGCIKCDSSYHPFSHVRVDSLLKTFSLQYGFLW